MAKQKQPPPDEQPSSGMDIYFLMDRSGSMCERQMDAIKGFNGMIDALKMVIMPPTLTLDSFGDSKTPERLMDPRPVYDIPKLTTDLFQIYGGTDILGSMAYAADQLEKHSKARRKVLIVLTDGDCYSGMDARGGLASRLQKLQADEGWVVIFLGMDDGGGRARVMANAQSFGAPEEFSLVFGSSKMRQGIEVAAQAVVRLCTAENPLAVGFTKEERKAVHNGKSQY